MITHGYYPKELVKSTIISIPKDKSASLSKSTNYRGISLFNSINKLFDYIIIDLCGDTLSTSDMQFGYKPNHSTISCTTVLKEIIKYYCYVWYSLLNISLAVSVNLYSIVVHAFYFRMYTAGNACRC